MSSRRKSATNTRVFWRVSLAHDIHRDWQASGVPSSRLADESTRAARYRLVRGNRDRTIDVCHCHGIELARQERSPSFLAGIRPTLISIIRFWTLSRQRSAAHYRKLRAGPLLRNDKRDPLIVFCSWRRRFASRPRPDANQSFSVRSLPVGCVRQGRARLEIGHYSSFALAIFGST